MIPTLLQAILDALSESAFVEVTEVTPTASSAEPGRDGGAIALTYDGEPYAVRVEAL